MTDDEWRDWVGERIDALTAELEWWWDEWERMDW